MRGSIAAVLLAAAAASQQVLVPANPAHGDVRAEKDGLVLPAGEFAAIELIEATASFLCRNYLYDAHRLDAVQGFRLQRRLAVDALGTEELLYSLLASRNLAVLPIDEVRGVYGIVSLDDGNHNRWLEGMPMPWRSRETILHRPQLRELVFTHLTLVNVSARDMSNMLRNSVVPGGWHPGMLLAYAANDRALMLHGYRDQVAQAIRLVEHIDRMTKPPERSMLQRIEALERRLAEIEARGR